MTTRRRGSRLLLVTGLVVVGALAVAASVTAYLGSPRLCGSCHTMEARYAAWATSPHAAVPCVDCHTPVRSRADVVGTLADRATLIARDVAWQREGIEAGDPRVEHVPVPDENCLRCHDPNRKATSGFRILIDHAEHAERNGSCVSCHVNTAHPTTAGVSLSLMVQCYTCHGRAEYPEASAECATCHPPGYELSPASHREPTWQKRHGAVSAEEPEQCGLCHASESCTGCHGVEMPHPDGWARGRRGHAAAAERDRAVCERCHTQKPDLCSMCHHSGYDPTRGDWEKQHYLEVRRRGTTYCFECHAPTYCVECHAR